MAKVLLADDSVTIHKVIEIILTAKGFALKAVADGDSALEAVRNFKPDVVLADIDMPGINGYDLAEKIKKNPSTKDIPVILLAGAFETIDNNRAQKSGATSTLIKPFESEDLVNKIREVLSPEAISAESEPRVDSSGEVLEVEGLESAGPEAEEDLMELEEESTEEPDLVEFETFEESVSEPGEELTELEPAEAASELEPVEAVPEAEEGLVEVESEEEAISEAEAELTAFEAEEDAIPFAEEGITAVESPVEEIEEAEEELTDIETVREEPSAEEAISVEDIREALMKSMDEKISEALAGVDMKSAIMEAITPTLSDAVEKVLWEIAPELTEKLAKETLTESMKDLKKELEQIIWETVPEIAENIISKEIKRIREES